MIDLDNLTIKKANEAFKNKEYTPRELTEEYLKVIDKRNGSVNAFREVFTADALKRADEAGDLFAKNKATILTGIPIATKDNILIKGHIAGASSKILENFVAPYDATAIARLREAGAVFLGRTNMDEFAMGSSTENSAYGPTHNPLDETRVPGGSSGGSAAAVAMNGALIGLGTDTGGSVRQPGALCGLVGFKPTYGAISRNGLIAMGSSLDQLGTLTKNVDDSEIIFNAVRGTDKMDSTSFYPDTKYEIPKKLTIGVPRNLLEGLDTEVADNFEESIGRFEDNGFIVKDISLPNLKYALAVYYVIMPAEVSSNLARFDGVRYGVHKEGKDLLEDYINSKTEGFGRETRRRIMLGTYVLSSGYYNAYYNKAVAVKDLIRADYDSAFKDVDLVLTPTTPTAAFLLGEKTSDPLKMYLEDVFTVPANISGNPAISIPSGTVKVGEVELPLGVQLVAPHYQEDLLFNISKNFLGE
jgi:aspartyl-tRNA(Asn)/glutamyl-tRNA(Gln) amidotransferase subunit A